ncbi:MAG: NAD(P)-dependent oxidoreductase [Verrucomicrobiia bacterium]
MKVCVAGHGLIGSIWERHYRADGHEVTVWNRTPRSLPNYEGRAARAVKGADVVHVVVSDPPAVRSFLRKVMRSLKPGALVIQSSTIDPVSAAEFAAMVVGAGKDYVEAPFTGSKPAAESRELVFFVGGDGASREKAEGYLGRLSARRVPFGSAAQAAAVKLAMNLQIATVTEALVEGLHLARSHGISREQFFEVLGLNVAHSRLADFKRPKLDSGDFSPQFSAKWLLKDLRLALGTLSAAELPATAAAAKQLKKVVARGLGDQDFTVVATLFPSWSREG